MQGSASAWIATRSSRTSGGKREKVRIGKNRGRGEERHRHGRNARGHHGGMAGGGTKHVRTACGRQRMLDAQISHMREQRQLDAIWFSEDGHCSEVRQAESHERCERRAFCTGPTEDTREHLSSDHGPLCMRSNGRPARTRNVTRITARRQTAQGIPTRQFKDEVHQLIGERDFTNLHELQHMCELVARMRMESAAISPASIGKRIL